MLKTIQTHGKTIAVWDGIGDDETLVTVDGDLMLVLTGILVRDIDVNEFGRYVYEMHPFLSLRKQKQGVARMPAPAVFRKGV